MAKTRSRSLNLVVKKEEHQEKIKLEQVLHGTNNASKSKSKITKNKKPVQVLNAEVKSENANDNKVLLASPKKKTFPKFRITAEKITKLIGYIVNDKLNVTAAAKKVGMSASAAYTYYNKYQDDPEHKIPLPKRRLNKTLAILTQEKIDNLIHYIVNDGMNVSQASKKAGLYSRTAAKYYAKYLKDLERKTPLLADYTWKKSKRYTQEEITDLIGYIVRDKMTVLKASKKVNMSRKTAKRYYLKYLHHPNHEIPDPHKSDQRSGRPCTNDQVASLIGYIVNDGMTLVEASVKANICEYTASKYYRQYVNDPEKSIPTPEIKSSPVIYNPSTVDQVKNFFGYVIIDKLNISEAARKAKLSINTGYRYYNKYLKSANNQTEIKDMSYSVEKMKRLVELVQNEKMSLTKAADIVHLNVNNARKYYKQYLKNPQHGFPAIKKKQRTQEDIRKLIDYIRNNKMSIRSAAKRIKMTGKIAQRYYTEYLNDPEHRIPVPKIRGHTMTIKTSDKFAKIIADIYKNNPSIKPVHGNQDVELDALAIEIKKELKEEDTKMALKNEE